MLSQSVLHRGQFSARHVVSVHVTARQRTVRLACLPQTRQQHTAAASAAAVEPASVPGAADRSNPDSRPDRKPKRKPSSPQLSTVLREAAAAVGGALPDVLCATLPDTFPTLSAARRVIRKDLILVDGALGSCKTEVSAGQHLQQLEPVSKGKGPRAVSLQVLYEDDELAVVHKPWGVKMYGGDVRRTVTGALRAGSGALQPSSAADALPEPKPLHRLDAAVGGVLLIAKTASAAAELSEQFVTRRVHKVYHALLCGQLVPGTAAASDAPVSTASSRAGQQQEEEGETAAAAASSTSAGISSSSSSSSSLDEESVTSEAQSDTEDQQGGEAAQLLPLQELLQRQLQGTPAFTVTAQDLADPVLLSPLDAAAAAAGAADWPSSGSSSSSGSGSNADAAGLGEGVSVVDLAVESKPSYSLYKVLGYSRSSRYGGWVTSVALSPVTGRKHQLRRHMAALGCPIVGDGKYALTKEEHISNQGIYLESLEIAFTHPKTQQRLHISLPEPPRFAMMRQQLHNRWRKVGVASPSDTEAGEAAETS